MSIFDSPYIVFAFALVVQGLAAYAGDLFRTKVRSLRKEERQDFDILRTASLTLLGLIIGFSFAMAISRYDERKRFEVAEANAIGAEYVRADLLPSGDAAHVRALLRHRFLLILPFIVSMSFLLIADIDSPRGGVIRVHGFDLIARSQSMKSD